MEHAALKLLLDKFDDLEERAKERHQTLASLVSEHIKESTAVHKTVERHSAYFSVVGLGVTPLLGWIAYKLGWK